MPTRRALLRMLSAACALPFGWAAWRVGARHVPRRHEMRLGTLAEIFGDARVRTVRLADRGVILRRTATGLIAFDAACTHGGCPVAPTATGFHCSCHDGRFDLEGRPVGGPPKRALARPTLVERDGVWTLSLVA